MNILHIIEADALKFVANEIESNKAEIVAAAQAAPAAGSDALAVVNAKIEAVFPAMVRPLIATELQKVEAEELAQLSGDAPALVDKVVALLNAEAAKLLA